MDLCKGSRVEKWSPSIPSSAGICIPQQHWDGLWDPGWESIFSRESSHHPQIREGEVARKGGRDGDETKWVEGETISTPLTVKSQLLVIPLFLSLSEPLCLSFCVLLYPFIWSPSLSVSLHQSIPNPNTKIISLKCTSDRTVCICKEAFLHALLHRNNVGMPSPGVL